MRPAVVAGMALLVASAALAEGQESRFFDQIEVRRIEVPVRVLDDNGEVVAGLEADDLEVVVDGVSASPESVEWYGAGESEVAEVGTRPSSGPRSGRAGLASQGRLIVCLFQLDFHPSRLSGLMRMTRRADELIHSLAEEDRMAVVVFDSHLRLHLDFTGDRARLLDEIRPTRLFSTELAPATGSLVSLLDRLDLEAARDAALPESGLRVLAEALEEIPGTKTLVFFGWGMGRFSRSGVRMDRDYAPARDALARAQTSVFTLDVTEADFHSLEVGLQLVARDTGGFYARTHLFPDGAIQRLERALSGHYLVVFESPVTERGRHALLIRLTRRQGRVLARSFFED